MNSTFVSQAAANPVIGYLDSVGTASVLYLESLWARYYAWVGSDFLATGLLFLVIHEVVYFGRSLPWYILDRTKILKNYKIQDKEIPDSEQLQCLKDVLISHFVIEAIPIFGFQPICNIVGIDYSANFPALKYFLIQITAFFFMEDTWHYWFHRLLHYGPFYKHIHKQHHKYAAPFGLTAEYAHPIEVAVTGLGTVGSPLLWSYFFGHVHLVTVITWVVLRLFQAIDAHSGYEFPWSLHHFFPIWAGADHHDDHHKFFVGNYSSSFRHWDYVLGTETPSTARKHTFLKNTSVLDKKKK
ncbi:uncharacterized protein SAPINGB_P000601 [Magnusiomyces paraingens]|uniref:Fatty acid hydroxylase domain-containing protein n=1 Tax=Magnusiomyces paraingens TaxID=2606893 RepID=A0A5E8B2H4_9ASCO|nr:uncharacterized protein SAPINGB_P000601 [Saprochaete ingens]VVT44990.1 unnamed protein product [Saprochaete ingens]